MMHRLTVIFSISALAAMSAVADPLDAVFARIDAVAKTFKGMAADISNTQHTAIVDSDDVQTGTIKLLRVKPGVTRILVDWKGDTGAQIIALDEHEGRIYNRKANVEDVYPLADRQSTVNQLLLLGFGATSEELKATYDITYVADENVDGRQTSHLKLLPKSVETKRTMKQADLWFAQNGLVAQQKFVYPSGDFKLAKYTNVKLGSIPEKDLELKLPKGATIQKH